MSRPRGLRLSPIRRPWFRLDSMEPQRWSWRAYPTPRSRFDSANGSTRVRYAGDAPRVAMRERFDGSGRIVAIDDLDLRLVELTGAVSVLDLRREQNLDALGLDDQVSTARSPEVWATCQSLVDQVHEWFGARCHGLVYRSRTTPQRSANFAFFDHATLVPRDLGPLGEQEPLLASCVLSDGFAIQGWR